MCAATLRLGVGGADSEVLTPSAAVVLLLAAGGQNETAKAPRRQGARRNYWIPRVCVFWRLGVLAVHWASANSRDAVIRA